MHIPRHIKLHKAAKTLELTYDNEPAYLLSAEFLRVHSPSAEVQGHGNPILQYGKQQVGLETLEPVGRYALRLVFDDGHDSGLYSWDYLFDLAHNQEQLWQDYLKALHQAGKSRAPDTVVIQL